MNFNAGKVIEQMIVAGYEFSAGRHEKKLVGFWANFASITVSECEECGGFAECCWCKAGHALKLFDAIAMARSRALGHLTHVPPSEFFKKNHRLKT